MREKLQCFILFLLMICAVQSLTGQACDGANNGDFLHGNDVRAYINNSGSLFFDGDDGIFQVPFTGANTPKTLFAQGLWIGGFDAAANLKLSAQTYGLASFNYDYLPGPLSNDGQLVTDCSDWDKAWSVRRMEIEAHIADFADNSTIDDPDEDILAWPGKGNPHFLDVNGFDLPDNGAEYAPFFDNNSDGIYDPMDGDYPFVEQSSIIPEQIMWTVFNDLGFQQTNYPQPLSFEIQLTTWALACADNTQLNRTIFNSYRLINRSGEAIDSVRMGLWTDPDLGCHTDDYIGSAPELNTMYVYNNSNVDDIDCIPGVQSYGENPPVQAMTILNRNLAHLMYYVNGGVGSPPPGMTDPATALEYYYFLTGRWRDGTPLTYGGGGYDPTGMNPVTNFAFPEDPNDPDGWSQLTVDFGPADQRTVGTVYLGLMQPGDAVTVDIGYSFFREEGSNYLENVTAMYNGIPDLQSWYDQGFSGACSVLSDCEEDCVWTGDTNADGIANNCDLLPVGLALADQGPQRDGPYIWAPKDGDTWSGNQYDGTNVKHVDANGDGLIEAEDFTMTMANYRNTRPDYVPMDTYDEGPEITIRRVLPVGDFEGLQAGESFIAVVEITEVPDLFGLSFVIEFDTNYFEFIDPFGPGFSPEEMEFRQGFRAIGETHFARISTDMSEMIEEGDLFLLDVQVKEAFPDPLPSDMSPVRFKNVKGVENDGTPIDLGGTTINATFQGIAVASEEEEFEHQIEVFPNPTSGRLYIVSPGLVLESVQVMNLAGQEMFRQEGLRHEMLELELGDLPKGLYLVKMRSGEQVVVRKVVVE